MLIAENKKKKSTISAFEKLVIDAGNVYNFIFNLNNNIMAQRNKHYSKAASRVKGEHKGKVVNSDPWNKGKTSWELLTFEPGFDPWVEFHSERQ